MMSERDLVARHHCLDADALHDWIGAGILMPHRDESGYLFDDVDEARVALICDLHYHMGLGHESLPFILSLVDQLHEARHSLRAMTAAVGEQSDDIRVAISTRTRVLLRPRKG